MGFDESVVEKFVEGFVLPFGHGGLELGPEIRIAVGEDRLGDAGKLEPVVGVKIDQVAKLRFDLEDRTWCCVTYGRDSNVIAEDDLREKPIGDRASRFFERRRVDDGGF